MNLHKGLRVRLASTGDPPPHHYVRQDGPCWRWGVNRQELGLAMSEEAAVDAAWRRFRRCALVPEAGAEIVQIGRVSSGAEIAQLKCRDGRIVGYDVAKLQVGWEVEPSELAEIAATSDKSRRMGT